MKSLLPGNEYVDHDPWLTEEGGDAIMSGVASKFNGERFLFGNLGLKVVGIYGDVAKVQVTLENKKGEALVIIGTFPMRINQKYHFGDEPLPDLPLIAIRQHITQTTKDGRKI